MMRLLNYLCTFLLAKRALCGYTGGFTPVSSVFMHVGSCTSGIEINLGVAGSPAECQTLCQSFLPYGSGCKYFTLAASGSGACIWEESCTSHSDNAKWKGYRVASATVEPVFMHVGDCNAGGTEVKLGVAGNLFECQTLCLNKYGANCQYVTLAASGSGFCYWEPSCTSHNDNAIWKGYRVGDVRCATDECRRQTFTCPKGKECLALCNGRNACDHASIIADFSTSLTVSGSYYSLQGAVVRCPRNGQCNVECVGPDSCQYIKVYYHDLAELNVICTGSDSCVGLQKLSSANA